MSSSSATMDGDRSSWLLVLSVNISMTIVVLALISHLSAVYILFRPKMRRRVLTPWMVNISIVSLVLIACGYSVTLGVDFIRETNSNMTMIFRCRWSAFVGILCRCAFSSTLCVMNVLSKIFMFRCSGGHAQPISRKSNITLLLILWIYPLFMGAVSYFAGDLYHVSASELTCHLNWPSHEYLHLFFNTFSSFAIYLLPMVVCLTMQYYILRLWHRFRHIENTAIRRKLLYRRRNNNMVIALTVFFFASQLPYHMANVVAMVTGYYAHSHTTAFALELLAESNVLCPPFAYLILNTRYRWAVRLIISGGARPKIQNERRHERILQHRRMRARARLLEGGHQRRVLAPNRVEPLPQRYIAHQASASTKSTQSQMPDTGTMTLQQTTRGN